MDFSVCFAANFPNEKFSKDLQSWLDRKKTQKLEIQSNSVRYNREFVITVIVITKFDCTTLYKFEKGFVATKKSSF